MKGIVAQGEKNNWVIEYENEKFPLHPLEKIEKLYIGQNVNFEIVKIEYSVDGDESFFYCARVIRDWHISDKEIIEFAESRSFPDDILKGVIIGCKWYRDELNKRSLYL